MNDAAAYALLGLWVVACCLLGVELYKWLH